jgi:anti-sigma factor RsiW
MNPTDFTDSAWVFDQGVPAHVSFEALSAMVDGELTASERQLVDEHLAGCANCQTNAALFAAADPADSVAGSVGSVSGFEQYRRVASPPSETKAAAMAAAMAAFDRELTTVAAPLEALEAGAVEAPARHDATVIPFHRKRSTRFFGAAAVVAVLTVGSSSVLQSAFVEKDNSAQVSSDLASEEATPTTTATDDKATGDSATAEASADTSGDVAAETSSPSTERTRAAEESVVAETTPAAADFEAATKALDQAPQPGVTTADPNREPPPVAGAIAPPPPPAPAPAETTPPTAPVTEAPTAPAAPARVGKPDPAPTSPSKKAAPKRSVKRTPAASSSDLGALGLADSVESALGSFGDRVGLVPETTVPAAAADAAASQAPAPTQPPAASPAAGTPAGDGSGVGAPDPAVPAPPAAAAPATPSTAAPAAAQPAAPGAEEVAAPPTTFDPTCSAPAAAFGTVVQRATATVPVVGEIRIFLVTKDAIKRFIVFDSRCVVVSNRLALPPPT